MIQDEIEFVAPEKNWNDEMPISFSFVLEILQNEISKKKQNLVKKYR